MKLQNIFLILFLILLVSCAQQQEHIVEQAPQDQIKNVDIIKNGDTSNIVVEDVNYFENSVGFLAKPNKEGIYPAVVMIHEWWGLNDNIKEMARSLAADGYVVLAVDLFGKVGKNANEARGLSTKARNNMEMSIKNMKAAVEFLKNKKNVDKDKIASMGWCFGGQMSLQLSLNEKMAATIIYYGQLETNATKLSVIKWPVLGIFGEKDISIPVESARKFDAALDELKIENEIYIYPNVGHAFANPSGANYAPNETKDAWEKTLRFLEKNLKNKINVIEDTSQLNHTLSKISPYPFVENEEFQKTHGTNLTIQGNKIIFRRIFTRPTVCDKFDYFVTRNDSNINIKPKRIQDSSDTCVAIVGYDSVEINITLNKGKYKLNLYQTDYYKNYPSNDIIFTKEIEIFWDESNKNNDTKIDEKIFTSIPDQWKICDEDSDCVETQGGKCPCSMSGRSDAINKKYLDLWIQNLEKFGTIVCLARYVCFEVTPKCIDKKCKLVPS